MQNQTAHHASVIIVCHLIVIVPAERFVECTRPRTQATDQQNCGEQKREFLSNALHTFLGQLL